MDRLVVSLLFVALLAMGSVARAGDKSAELMAAYVYNFARFIEWPAALFPSDKTPLVLCTPDTEALDGHLLRVHGRVAQGRRIVVRLVEPEDNLTGCHLLFLPRELAAPNATLLATAAGKPLLTVGNAPGFLEEGGMVGLFVQADRVHFDIDRDAARAAGLRVSSRLLALARVPPGGAR